MKVKEIRQLLKTCWLEGKLLWLQANSFNSSILTKTSYGYKCSIEVVEKHLELEKADYWCLFWDDEDCDEEHGLLFVVKEKDHYKIFDSYSFGYEWFKKMVSNSYINSSKYEFEFSHSNLYGVRWMGAFRRSHSLFDSIEHELSSLRERAADIYVGNHFTTYEGEYFNVDLLEQIELKCSKEDKDAIYEYCKLAFLYSPMSIRKTFCRDCYSIEVGRFLIDNPTYDNYESNNLFDFLVTEDEDEYGGHTEGFIKVGSKPYGMLIRKPDTWSPEILELVKEVAKQNNLLLYIVEW